VVVVVVWLVVVMWVVVVVTCPPVPGLELLPPQADQDAAIARAKGTVTHT
jgi:hypothetical protein